MQLLLLASVGLMLGAALGVGGRLLLLGARNRQLPELSIGICFYATAAVGYPLMLGSGWGGTRVGQVNPWLLGPGCLAVAAGMTFLYVFTWRVFRRDSAGARACVVAAAALLSLQALGTVGAVLRAPAEASPYAVTRHWSALQLAVVGIGLAWTGLESLRYHRVLRRRLALGLVDPVVANRVLLWAIFGLSTTAIVAVNAVIHFGGVASLEHPASQLATALGGLVAGGAMYLAFLPPVAYRRWVERRARASVPTDAVTAGG